MTLLFEGIGVKFATKEISASVSERKLRAFRVLVKESSVFEIAAGIGDVLCSFVSDVSREAGWIDDDVVVVEEREYLVVDWRHPAYALNHPAQFFIHYYQLSIGPQIVFWVIPEYLYWISCKSISGSSVMDCMCHDVGVNLRLLGGKNRVDACCQQTPTFWPQNRMQTNDLNHLKSGGTIAAQTPSKAPAPLPLPQVHGASAGETTADHARTASARGVSAGGGQRVSF